MRIVGRRREPPPGGPRWPSPEEIRRSVELAEGIVYHHPKGVERFRNHAEANAAMEELIADAMARKSAELVRRKR